MLRQPKFVNVICKRDIVDMLNTEGVDRPVNASCVLLS